MIIKQIERLSFSFHEEIFKTRYKAFDINNFLFPFFLSLSFSLSLSLCGVTAQTRENKLFRECYVIVTSCTRFHSWARITRDLISLPANLFYLSHLFRTHMLCRVRFRWIEVKLTQPHQNTRYSMYTNRFVSLARKRSSLQYDLEKWLP